MHRHPQSDRARHPPRHRQRRPRRQTGGDHGRPSRRRRHRHGGPRRSGAASRCPRRRRRLGARTVFAPELSGLDTERGAFMAPTLLRADDPASSPAHVVEPFGPVSTLLGYQDLDGAVALVAKGRGSLVAPVSGPTPTRPRGSPSGSHRSTAGSTPSTQHPPLRRPAMVHRFRNLFTAGPVERVAAKNSVAFARCFITCSAPRAGLARSRHCGYGRVGRWCCSPPQRPSVHAVLRRTRGRRLSRHGTP